MPRVIISSGHTSQNPGIIANGLNEYELARKIAKYALKYIRQNGLISLSTPPNLELAQRIEWINKTGYNKNTNDLAIEVHINDGGKRGIEGWYEGEGNSPSLDLTSRIVESLCEETKLPNQGIKSEFQHELGSISFIHEVFPIACVIECGYIDNLEDAAYLKEERNLDSLGKGIAKGVLKYFNLEFKEFNAVVESAPVNQFQPQDQPIATAPAPAMPQAYDKTLETQTDRYDKDDFDPDLEDDDDYYDIDDDQVIAKPAPVIAPAPQPASYMAPQTPYAPSPAMPSYQAPAAPSQYTPLPSREERKDMIVRNYSKILGREPNQNDLNYFLNIGIREDELIKKMIESQEHVDLVKSKQELIELKEKFIANQNELQELRTQNEDTKNIVENLHESIDQKNVALSKLQYDIKELQEKLMEKPVLSKTTTSGKKYQGSFADKVFKALSDILE